MSTPRIFVNIAAYRDTECQWTVKDLFEKASDPDRVFLGICWQFVAEEDADCFLFRTRPDQCRVIEVPAGESLGACWARHRAESLWQGEEYLLQIDSHMRVVQDWDEKMIAMLAACPSERAVLSSYPPSYTPPNTLGADIVSTMYAREFNEDGVLRLHSRGVSVKEAPATPQPNPFCAAGFLFGPGEIIRDVPYDPYLYFQGEEISLAARLWTHGWDIHAPNGVLIYHDYTKRADRPRHWQDHKRWTKLNIRASKRLRHLLGMETCDDPEAIAEIDRYGLGTRRTLAEYMAFSGVDFPRRLINGKSAEDLERELKPEERRQRTADVFGKIYLNNTWGSQETRSGPGSSLTGTQTIRSRLSELFDFLDIRVVGDAGCGDLNWMSQISEGLRFYFGYDVVGEMVEDLRKRYRQRGNHFFVQADVTLDTLPACDAILCRDVLTHLPDHLVKDALTLFRASGSRYLIATTHKRGRNDPVKLGNWQPIDLSAPPFSLPPPRTLLSEDLPNSSKALGVWLLRDLPETFA
ncbi:MAG: methyltransferase domain-containing protein [Alphaproteobacteria bacterium]|nr:methyltransferase domain-containing protein [Alphaproteobacteria bacterium]